MEFPFLKKLITESAATDEQFAKLLRNAKLGSKLSDNYSEVIRVPLGDAVFIDDVDGVCLSAEKEITDNLLDYYGEEIIDHEPGFISPKLEEFARKYGRRVEWRDPGSVCFYKD